MYQKAWRVFVFLVLISLILAACATPTPAVQPTSAVAGEDTVKPTETKAPEATATTAASPTPEPPTPTPMPMGTLVVSCETQATWVRNFNPFGGGRWPTTNGIYEPLMLLNSVKNELLPWLATEYKWEDDATRLVVTIREGVMWSDGQAFTAKDVEFTFNLMQNNGALQGPAKDAISNYLSSIQAIDDKTVEFVFKKKFIPAIYDILAQNIVPEHIWSKVEDPAKTTNDNPVGTGPFTEVRDFKEQVWELGRNPNYWQPGKPAFDAIRCPALSGNDQSQLALINGELDWSSISIPDIEQTFIAQDPANYGYWFPTTGMTWMLYLNTTKKPFDDVRVRQAISMAIDRQQIVDVPMNGYTHLPDATGLSDGYPSWKSQAAVDAGKDLVTYNPEKANALLDEAGLAKDKDGFRSLDGKPLEFEIIMISGWNDTVAASDIIAQNLNDVGIKASVKTGDWGFWSSKITTGDFDLSMGWSSAGSTPLNFYRGQMSSTSFKPVGESAWENWSRFVSKEADDLISTFGVVADEAVQQRIMADLQMVFVKDLPAIPLYAAPAWYEYSQKNFTGWPTKDDPYAEGAINEPERLLILTTLQPK